MGTKLIGGLMVLLCTVLLVFMDTDYLSQVATDLGPLGALFLMLFLAVTQILAPFPGTPGILLSLKLYGFDMTTLLLMGSFSISAVVNFFLARRFGRPLVMRLVGPERMTTVDRLVRADEVTLLLLARVFGFAFFDLISYAIGLTQIRFKHYILYSVLFSVPPMAIQYVVFKDMDFQSPAGLLFFMVSVVGAGVVFSWFFLRLLQMRTQENH